MFTRTLIRTLAGALLVALCAVVGSPALAQDASPDGAAGAPQAAAQETAIARQRAANLAAYAKLRDGIRREHKGAWVVIERGQMTVLHTTLDQALRASRESSEGQRAPLHRLVFRAGDEDVPAWSGADNGHGSLRSGDLGAGLSLPVRLTQAFGGGARLFSTTPDGKQHRVEQVLLGVPERKGEVTLRPFVNTGFGGGVVVEPKVARQLGLARFELPGLLEGQVLGARGRPGTALTYPARRAWVRLRLTGMKAPTWVEAAIPTAVR